MVLTTLACLGGCRDNPAAAAEHAAGGAKFVATVVCGVDVKARRTTCQLVRESASAGAHGPRLTVIRDASAMVQTGDDSYTPADSTYRLQVRLVNTSETALGTRDGTTVTGIKAFIPVNIMGYAGRQPGDTTDPYGVLVPPMANVNNQVQARNPDGRIAFTAANQPYWNYAQKLQPGETSQWREWRFTLNPSVSYFYFAVSVLAGVPGETVVPGTVPRGLNLPVRYHSSAFLRPCRISGFPRCVYDAVDIRFRSSATQEERQAAVDLIDGRVEGWSYATDEYFVRIPGDSTFTALRNALTTLRALPQVELAVPYGPIELSPSYLRPNDGANWDQWQVKDSLADGRNWALEAIAAPLAWGCDTGAVSARVAIVDTDFHLVADLQPNVHAGDTLVGKLTTATDSGDHGTAVAAIVAAAGNNGSGMTGTLWRASARVYETASDSAGSIIRNPDLRARILDLPTMSQIDAAVRNGATVVNVSLAFWWSVWAASNGWIPPGGQYDPGAETNPQRVSDRDIILMVLGNRLNVMLDRLRADGFSPLVVLGAGNESISATWNPYTRLSAANRANVIVVGSVRNAGSGRLAFSTGFSNHGDTLDVVAPGEDVWTLNRNGAIRTSGTWVAAPHVTGAAGLLLSFDPRLANRGDSLKRLLVEGATRGSRRVLIGAGPDSIAVLHVYESLKLVAARRGAPLCGNRMWTDSRQIIVQRGSGTETLVDLGGGISRDDIDVLHGGRQMRVNYTGQFGRDSTLTYVLQNNAWNQQGNGVSGWAVAVPGSGGTYLASHRRSHGGDTLVRTFDSKEFGAALLDVYLTWTGGSRMLTQLRRPQTADGLHEVCNVRVPLQPGQDTASACITKGLFSGYSESVGWMVAYSPTGREIIVRVSRYRGTSTVSAWSTCPWPVTPTTPRRECRSFNSVSSYDPSEILAVNVVTGAQTNLFTIDGSARRLTPDESGSELMFLRENSVLRQTHGPGPNYMQFVNTNEPAVRTCAVEVRTLRTGALKATIPGVDCVATDHGVAASPVRSLP